MGRISRKEFLRGQVAGSRSISDLPLLFRPPNALPEERFLTTCEQCDACFEVCPTHIIRHDQQGFPFMNFGMANCTFCGKCEEVCEPGALDSLHARVWSIGAEVNSKCLSFNGVVCRACEESCEENAIRFKLLTAGRSIPLIHEQDCTGCGACAAICPNSSIIMNEIEAEPEIKEVMA